MREEALKRLKATLTKQQVEDLKLVIQTADVQGDWVCGDDDGSMWSDDVQTTLENLSAEFS